MPTQQTAHADPTHVGNNMYQLMRELYPFCRSITGNGNRKTLEIIKQHIPLVVHEVPTGTQVFDWQVPKEWNITDAYIKNGKGERIVDFRKSNLHVLNYSMPVKKKVSLAELKQHVFAMPEHPDWIPYRTSYYKEQWAFCMTYNQLSQLTEQEYEVCVDSTLKDGHLTYGEYHIPGETPDRVLISSHICHPSICNDNLSGIVLNACLAKHLSRLSPRYSYTFLFVPGTIGPITWLARNETLAARIKHGLVAACVGDGGNFNYKRSRRGNDEIDRAVIHVLKHSGRDYQVWDYVPTGYDERQYCSPGFNLPVGCLMRTPNGMYPEYHSSADNLDLVRPEFLAESFSMYTAVLDVIEKNKIYVNQNPKCEPQLGKRGLYALVGGQGDRKLQETAVLWVLNLSDGEHSLLDIAEQSGLRFDVISEAADVLLQHDLLKEILG